MEVFFRGFRCSLDIVERALGVLRLSCSSFRGPPTSWWSLLVLWDCSLRRDLLNSDDAKCPHLRILGATLMSSWGMERLLSKVEQGESLDTRSTSIQLREARDELHLLMRGIDGIQKLCELESDDS